MVDLAIASNFARELTEEQFAGERRRARREAPAGRGANGASAAVRTSDRHRAPRRQATSARRAAGFGATRLGRTLARLVQVRG
jgi:hypothetical protein